MEGLADRLRVIAPDLPGHGALAGIPFRLELAVREVADVIDAEAGGRALKAVRNFARSIGWWSETG